MIVTVTLLSGGQTVGTADIDQAFPMTPSALIWQHRVFIAVPAFGGGIYYQEHDAEELPDYAVTKTPAPPSRR
jgi:hypothetical protein